MASVLLQAEKARLLAVATEEEMKLLKKTQKLAEEVCMQLPCNPFTNKIQQAVFQDS